MPVTLYKFVKIAISNWRNNKLIFKEIGQKTRPNTGYNSLPAKYSFEG